MTQSAFEIIGLAVSGAMLVFATALGAFIQKKAQDKNPLVEVRLHLYAELVEKMEVLVEAVGGIDCSFAFEAMEEERYVKYDKSQSINPTFTKDLRSLLIRTSIVAEQNLQQIAKMLHKELHPDFGFEPLLTYGDWLMRECSIKQSEVIESEDKIEVGYRGLIHDLMDEPDMQSQLRACVLRNKDFDTSGVHLFAQQAESVRELWVKALIEIRRELDV